MSRRVLVLLVAACIGVTAVLSGAILRTADEVVTRPAIQPARGETSDIELQWPLLDERPFDPLDDPLDRLGRDGRPEIVPIPGP